MRDFLSIAWRCVLVLGLSHLTLTATIAAWEYGSRTSPPKPVVLPEAPATTRLRRFLGSIMRRGGGRRGS